MNSSMEQLQRFLGERGIVRASEVEEEGLSRDLLRRGVDSGVCNRVARGLYVAADHEYTEHHELAVASKLVSDSVICLISALSVHELTTQIPHVTWIMIETDAWKPKIDAVELEVVRASGEAFERGRASHTIEGVEVQVTIPAKTVADCFRYRSRIGLDVALEALREGFSEGAFSMDELWTFAEIDRVANVIRPYAEAL